MKEYTDTVYAPEAFQESFSEATEKYTNKGWEVLQIIPITIPNKDGELGEEYRVFFVRNMSGTDILNKRREHGKCKA